MTTIGLTDGIALITEALAIEPRRFAELDLLVPGGARNSLDHLILTGRITQAEDGRWVLAEVVA